MSNCTLLEPQASGAWPHSEVDAPELCESVPKAQQERRQ
jgi:hypothetical protein